MAKARVAVLISGRGSNLAALLEAAADPAYPAEIALVISNRPEAGGLDHARKYGVPVSVVDSRPHKGDREAFERSLLRAIPGSITHLCLAGFMRILTPTFIAPWDGRILNIHPALLPSFKGLHTHERALEAGVKIHGATVHVVVPEMDSGPIVAQGAVAVREGDTPETLGARVLAVEHRIYPLALRLMAEGRVRLQGGICTIDGHPTPDTRALIVPSETG